MARRPPTRVRRHTVVAAAAGAAVWALALLLNRSMRRVTGSSMRPTLEPGDLLLVVPVRTPRVGDIVVVRDPRRPQRETVKRVVAGPGQPADLAGEVARVPEGHVAVAGDDRVHSTDSRHYGPVRACLAERRVLARVWPHPRRLPGGAPGRRPLTRG